MKTSRRKFIGNTAKTAALAYLAPLANAASKDAIAGVDVTGIRQQIDGFGFCEAFHEARNLQSFPEKERAFLLDLLFSANGGMGFSILRNIVGDGATVENKDGTTASIEPAPGVWNWAGDEDQIWLMNEAKRRGCTRFLSSVWSPPAWMKTNKQTSDGGSLRPDKYQDFAEYLAAYVFEYKSRYGLDIYAISPTNEPNYKATWSSCLWTGEELRNFIRKNLVPALAAKGVSPEIVIDEHAHWSDEYINAILADPICNQAIHIVAAHAYAATDQAFMPYSTRTGSFPNALKQKKRIWQTEVSAGDKNIVTMDDGVYWAGLLHAHLTQNDVSGWLWWWGTHAGNSRSSLIALDMTAKSYTLSKRLFTIGQYSRFIRPGSHRVNAVENPVGNVRFSAYLDPLGKQLICVAINDDSKDQQFSIQFGGIPATSCSPVRTSRTETHQRLEKLPVTNGQVTVQAPAMSVTTFILS